jgi:hypothetical protein
MDFIGINCLELSPGSRPLKRVQAGLDRGRILENRVRFSLSRYYYSTTDYIIFYLIGNMAENIS